jgi:hypothetical protein
VNGSETEALKLLQGAINVMTIRLSAQVEGPPWPVGCRELVPTACAYLAAFQLGILRQCEQLHTPNKYRIDATIRPSRSGWSVPLQEA